MSSWYAGIGPDRRLGALLALAGLLLSACGEQERTQASAAPPPAVSVVEVEPENVTASAQLVGRVAAIEKVELRARVQGFLERRLFTEGQNVEEGDLLYVIKQPPLEAQSGAVSKQDTAKAEDVQVRVLIAWTTAPVRPILAHHANEPCAKLRVGCADAPRIVIGRVSGNGAASRPRAAGPL